MHWENYPSTSKDSECDSSMPMIRVAHETENMRRPGPVPYRHEILYALFDRVLMRRLHRYKSIVKGAPLVGHSFRQNSDSDALLR
jgi:hypothetical protein